MARVFFAVSMPREASAPLRHLQSTLERSLPAGCLRLTEPEQAHFTLRFLGNASSDERRKAELAGQAAATSAGAFDLGLGALGVFPHERRAHTLWIGARRGAAELVDLAARLELQLAARGFAAAERPFVPHLTLARMKWSPPPLALRALLATSPSFGAAARVESFALLESRTTSTGVRYVPLATFRLETTCTRSE